MKLRHSAMLVALFITAWLAFFADKSPSNTIAEATRSSSASKAKLAQPPKPAQLTKATSAAATVPAIVGNILPIIDRRRLIAATDSSTVGVGEKARVFAMQSWMAPPPPPPKAPPPPAPTAPPLPFTYLGKQLQGGVWQVYLARGDETLIVREKTILNATYRIDRIVPPDLSLTYLPLQQAQTIAIGASD